VIPVDGVIVASINKAADVELALEMRPITLTVFRTATDAPFAFVLTTCARSFNPPRKVNVANIEAPRDLSLSAIVFTVPAIATVPVPSFVTLRQPPIIFMLVLPVMCWLSWPLIMFRFP
jgi:hypothetical protein